MDTPCKCKICGFTFPNVALFWKHKIEQTQCTHLKCGKCDNKKPAMFSGDDVDLLVQNNRNFIKIKWQDDYHCARAIMVGKAKADKDPDYVKIRNNSFWNLSAALYLHGISKVDSANCGISEIQMFQEALPGYQLFYIANTCCHKMFDILYIGPEAEKKIYIYEHNGRFDTIGRLSNHLVLSIFGY